MISFDILRSNTPHVDDRIHLNAAGCSLPSTNTLTKVHGYLDDECRFGGYEAAQVVRKEDVDLAYTELAKLLNCDATEIAVVTSATEAWLQVVYGLAFTIRCVVTSVSEYGSNYITYLQIQKRLGVEVVVIPETPDGCIDLDLLEGCLKKKSTTARPILVSITHIPTSSGKVYDAAAVGALAKTYGALYLLDACQSVGQRVVDVKDIQCDFLTGTGRKFLRAPRGSGFLYCSSKVMKTFEPGTIDVTSARWLSEKEYEVSDSMRRFEKYEMSYAAKVGLGFAVQECNTHGIHEIQKRIEEVATYLRRRLLERLDTDIQIQDRLHQRDTELSSRDLVKAYLTYVSFEKGCHAWRLTRHLYFHIEKMSHQYRPGDPLPRHVGKAVEDYRQNPKDENQQQALVNDWLLDLAQGTALRGHDEACHAKYEELKKHRVEVVQYLAAMRGWAMETTKTIRQLEKRTRLAEKEAAASKAEVLRLQALLSKNMGDADQDPPEATKKKRRKKRMDADDDDDSHASSVQ